jgi:twitching motility two-component system response regulator PilG
MNPGKTPAPRPSYKQPVMIIDDNRDILNALEFLLLSEGIESIVADDGLDALKKLDAGKVPCLILLDNAMPVMSGPQFLEAIHRNPRFASIPVYIISASGDFDGAAQAAGISGYIHKPFEPIRVLEIIRRHTAATPVGSPASRE